MDLKELEEEIKKLITIMEKLRGDNGCPWDKKQDYFSLKPYILEEAYEVVEALEERDIDLLKNELGDLLLQVVFQAQIGRERGDFNLKDVIAALNQKLVRRHPHVFGSETIEDVAEVLSTWEEIKEGERKETKSLLDGYSRSQSALNQAYELQNKAAEIGFDWDNVNDVVAKIEEELAEVKQAMKSNDNNLVRNELGDLLFAAVNLARFYRINPELSLLATIIKFKERFKYMEHHASGQDRNMEDMSLDELDILWEESKGGNNR